MVVRRHAVRTRIGIVVLATLSGLSAAVGFAADFYVAPNASASGTGSIGNPWKLPTALDHPAAV
jgi:hypothetical protein